MPYLKPFDGQNRFLNRITSSMEPLTRILRKRVGLHDLHLASVEVLHRLRVGSDEDVWTIRHPIAELIDVSVLQYEMVGFATEVDVDAFLDAKKLLPEVGVAFDLFVETINGVLNGGLDDMFFTPNR